ncbi:flagellar biosynthesis protein FlaG [Photobacterium sanctipauli]|uniref:Flagellar biosynthesis protein FlaG n=1 Tax=Photobacterium sanctipauli TaxID=1342794 RepID=A0A2T3NTJ7_9GAMM|nr:flagellar protein FlaG [Photobacterium sanctipauli]PSW19551.1 flagellar biosynthesis protein FlaG [Photobacterium sanctipauli]
MDVKPVSTSSSSFSSRTSSNSQSAVGTNIANKTVSHSQGTPLATSGQQQATSKSSDGGHSDVRRIEQSPNVEKQHQMQREELEKVVERIEEFVGSTINKGLSFRIDEESGKNIVTIYDKRTGEVVRQIPDEDLLVLSRRLAANSGGLVTTKV